jgi:tetratricopeptide (TPR) repeat protein
VCTHVGWLNRHWMASQTRNQLQAKRVAGAAGELFKEGKVDAAVEKFTEALEIIGDEVENEAGVKIKKGILLNRSAALIKIGEDEIVVDDCTEVLEMEPGNSKALFRRAMALVNLDRWQEAVSCSVCLISAAQPAPLLASGH